MKKLVTIILVCILSVLFLFGCSSNGSGSSVSDKKERRECVVLCNNNPKCSGTIYFKTNEYASDTAPTITDCLNNIDGIVDDVFFLKIDSSAEYSRHYHIIVFYYAN